MPDVRFSSITSFCPYIITKKFNIFSKWNLVSQSFISVHFLHFNFRMLVKFKVFLCLFTSFLYKGSVQTHENLKFVSCLNVSQENLQTILGSQSLKVKSLVILIWLHSTRENSQNIYCWNNSFKDLKYENFEYCIILNSYSYVVVFKWVLYNFFKKGNAYKITARLKHLGNENITIIKQLFSW